MRKNIFQILKEQFDVGKEIERINKLFESNLFIKDHRSYSPEELVDNYAFHTWKHRNRCINVDDMKESLEIQKIVDEYYPNIDDMVLYLEYVENILNLAFNYMTNNHGVEWNTDYTILLQNIDILLDHINHQTYYFDDEEIVLIAEKNAAATAVAEIVENKTSLKVIRYNHCLLRGDIQAKKDIILTLAADLEPKRKQLDKIDSKLTSNLFYMLNNLNLRHNNIDKSSKNYKEAVSKMQRDDLEKWYDETYQLELLALLLLDNEKRKDSIDSLKTKVEEEANA